VLLTSLGLIVCVCKWQIEKIHKFLEANGCSYLMFFYQEPEPDRDGGESINYLLMALASILVQTLDQLLQPPSIVLGLIW